MCSIAKIRTVRRTRCCRWSSATERHASYGCELPFSGEAALTAAFPRSSAAAGRSFHQRDDVFFANFPELQRQRRVRARLWTSTFGCRIVFFQRRGRKRKNEK